MGGGGRGVSLPPLEKGKIRFSGIYGAGAVIGYTPQQVDQMSIWEFDAALNGYIEANSTEEGRNKSMTQDEYEDIVEDILARN